MVYEKEWLKATNILCVRLDSLGDVLMTVPAIRALKTCTPERRITLLTSSSGAKAVPLIPEIDEVIVYEAPWMKTVRQAGSMAESDIIGRLRNSRFEAAVIFTVFSQNPLPAALIVFMAKIPLRLAHCRENPYNLLTNWVPEPDSVNNLYIRHEVRRQLDLVKSVGAITGNERITLSISPEVLSKGLSIMRGIGMDLKHPWIVFHPGATAPSRRYPPENFAEAAQKLASSHGFQVLFTGTKPETDLVESIRSGMKADSFSLAGRLDLRELTAVISAAPLLVSNNTAPVHIAAATGTPTVDLYALTNPQHTPWKVFNRTLYQDVPCKFCYKSICPMKHHDCLRMVSPKSVVRASLDLFKHGLRPDISERRRERQCI